jgi:RHS repeat-associated protein
VWASNAWKSDFTYDGLRRRRAETNYTWTSGGWVKSSERRFIYDGNLVIEERDGNNRSQVYYTRGRDLSGTIAGAGGIGGLLARTPTTDYVTSSQAANAFYFSDGNGNVTTLIGTNQLVLAKYVYDSFGNTISRSGPLADINLYRFSSKELHLNSALIYFGRRFYDPNLQRWLNCDPIEEAGGVNLYGAMGNDLVGNIDPDGLDFKTWWHNLWHTHGDDSTHDRNSNLSLRNDADTGVTQLTDENGNRVSPGYIVPKALGDASLTIATLPMGGEGEGAYLAADEALKALDAAKAARAAKAAKAATKVKCFKSFRALKNAMPNTPGKVWHHIVEQSQELRFGPEAIHNVNNVIEVTPEVNQSLNALYSSIRQKSLVLRL